VAVYDLNLSVAQQVVEADRRLREARDANEAARARLAKLEAVRAAVPQGSAAAESGTLGDDAEVIAAREAVQTTNEAVQFQASTLDRLLHPRWYERTASAVISQFVIFAVLAAVVLWWVMKGVNSPPPVGSTTRGMIAYLIAVITVGIALILVLSTIVSDAPDREKRFSQGKEVLTALIGVLGTIVGFYFGIAHDETKSGMSLGPIMLMRAADGSLELRTSVLGGKGPYAYEITFSDDAIPRQRGVSSDGNLQATLPEKATENVGFTIRVIDGDGLRVEQQHTPPKPADSPPPKPAASAPPPQPSIAPAST